MGKTLDLNFLGFPPKGKHHLLQSLVSKKKKGGEGNREKLKGKVMSRNPTFLLFKIKEKEHGGMLMRMILHHVREKGWN